MGYYGYGFRPYVSVAERRIEAQKKADALRKKGHVTQPVVIEGRTIATSFWGRAWCDHLEAFSDFENRMPRGRTYVRNGSVMDLRIEAGRVEALVSGSEIYEVRVEIERLAPAPWKQLVARCSGRIESVVGLLRGQLGEGVMRALVDRREGVFPQPGQMKMRCSCPDWATMCKHVAAALYGVGARLDRQPELLFVLRQVDQAELVGAGAGALVEKAAGERGSRIAADALGSMFGIEIDAGAEEEHPSPAVVVKPAPVIAPAPPLLVPESIAPFLAPGLVAALVGRADAREVIRRALDNVAGRLLPVRSQVTAPAPAMAAKRSRARRPAR